MQQQIPAAVFWSGGKDSSLALHRVRKEGKYAVKCLVTTVSREHSRISMHGVRTELLEEQAHALSIPLKIMTVPEAPDNAAYEQAMKEIFRFLKDEEIRHVIYGDIFLEDLKRYRDKHLDEAGLTGVYPLWKEDTSALFDEFVALGFKAVTVAVSKPSPGRKFAGRLLDRAFKEELPKHVDPCGENGEYHTFVFDGPIFNQPVAFEPGKTEIHGYKGSFEHQFYFTDLKPLSHATTT